MRLMKLWCLHPCIGLHDPCQPSTYYSISMMRDDWSRAYLPDEHVKSGKTTYVHCKAGRGRSTTIVLCYLVEHKGMTPVGAYEYVRLKRPRVLLATSQWQAVKEYNERIHGNCKTLIAPGSSLPLQCPVPLALSQRALTPDEGDRSFCYDDSVVFVTSADLDGYSSSDDACLVDTAYGVSKRCDKDVNIDCTFKTI